MKHWTKLSLLCLGLAFLGSLEPHVCRIVSPAGSYDLVAPANAAEKAPSLTWENLRSFDFQTGKIPPELKKLDGGIVRVPGFIIPLEDNYRAISEFLLVPYPLACIHVPPPPPNQIVHVKMDKNKKIAFDFYEPVWAQGRLKIQLTQNMYTDSSYFMTGLSVEPYLEQK